MKPQSHFTDQAPVPIGPYSQAVSYNGVLYLSGQIALQAATGHFIQNSIAEETHQVMQNIKALLANHGLGFDSIIKTSIFLKDMNHFAAVNEVYGTYFANHFPARETVEVARLPKDANVEISIIAALAQH